MSTHDLPQESELIVSGRKAAYCARRRLNGADLSIQDMEDMIQAATMAYWKHDREGRPIPFCFVCARQAVEKCFYRRIVGRNPRNPLSLDAPSHVGGDLPHEWLASSSLTYDDTLRLDWLSDEVLQGILFEARLAAGFSNRCLSRTQDTMQTDKRIIRLAANGHTNASIAKLVGTTEGTIRNRRQRIRRLLEHLLPPDAYVGYDRNGGNHYRAREIQMTYPNQQKPVPARQSPCLSPQIDTPKRASPDVGLASFFCRPFLCDGMSSSAMVDQGCMSTGLSRLDFSSGGRRHITE